MISELRGHAAPIPESYRAAMNGVTWHAELSPPSFDELSLLTLPFIDFDGARQEGEMVVLGRLGEQVVDIFEAIARSGFRIERMRLMHHYGGDDGASMADNNSSCFNSRRIINSERLSIHSYGRAIDINPIQNPVIRDGRVRPEAGKSYLDRRIDHRGLIGEDSELLRIFLEAGWKWGGHWQNPVDYHHFFIEE